MWKQIIKYFATRHLMTNFIVIGLLIGGLYFWSHTQKEELPDIALDFLRISAVYPGASPEDVEHFITKPIEEEIRGIDGIYRISSTSSIGSSTIRVELEPNYPDKDETITEIKNTVLDVRLPDDVIDEPRVRQFKTSKKAIIDIALIDTSHHLLDTEARRKLQTIALMLENKFVSRKELNSINRSGYYEPEIKIQAIPEKLIAYNIPFSTVMNEIKKNHIRQPAGSIENKKEEKVTLVSELDTVEKLKNLSVQGGFEGNLIRLKDIAYISEGFEKNKSIIKVNGHEGIILNVVKNSSYGILEAIEAVKEVVNEYRKTRLHNSSIKIVLLDDESFDLRNRLSIIGWNGTIGFTLILIMLFLFLNFRSGVWVAMGIPFTLCFTMVIASLLGYSINNITLAAVIIVLGMVVDDAIVVAENITRMKSQGIDNETAVIEGTHYVLMPIIASIITTCVAFLALLTFKGRFARMVYYIPAIITLMLAGSLFESIFILPGHMNLKMPAVLKRIFHLFRKTPVTKIKKKEKIKHHWFYRVEDYYGKIIETALKYKVFIFIVFIFLLLLAGYIFKNKMKFVLFPNEETTQLYISGITKPGTTKYETAEISKKVETIFSKYIGKEVPGFRTSIARSRRGGAVEENKFFMRVEIVPKEKRNKSVNQLILEWKKKTKKIKGINKLRFIKSRFGQSSGSPIEVMIQENQNDIRDKVAQEMMKHMKDHKALKNIEIEEPMKNPEYKIDLKKDKIRRLGINPSSISSTLRALLEGSILYELTPGDEEINVRFTSVERAKNNIFEILNVPVENKGNYLIPLRDIVNIQKVTSPNSIEREDEKRITKIFAGINEKIEISPIEIAEHFEKNVFPEIMSQYPSSIISFTGEIAETRESKGDFLFGVLMVLFLIYVILALLFNSLTKPIIIILTIPFGIVGIILAFWFHGMAFFGFFAGVGALGLAGVVVNDSIVMLVKLDKEYDRKQHKTMSNKQIAQIAKTRLRAVVLTTLTTVAGLFPTAYGLAGYDSMLAEMMLALSWGLIFGTLITLVLIPSLYSLGMDIKKLLAYVLFNEK